MTVHESCSEDDLNALHGEDPLRSYIEDKITELVDTPAGDAFHKLRAGGDLSTKNRKGWAKLLLSFGVRAPDTLRFMGVKIVSDVDTIIHDFGQEFPHLKGVAEAYSAASEEQRRQNWPRMTALNLMTKAEHVRAVLAMHWKIIDFGANVLLLGDRPLLAHPCKVFKNSMALDNPDCVICLPITPSRVFLAAAKPGSIDKALELPRARFQRILNEETLNRVDRYAYAREPCRSLSDWIGKNMAALGSRGVYENGATLEQRRCD